MRLLVLDTALGACSAALIDMDGPAVLAQASVPMERGHAEALFPMLAEMLNASGQTLLPVDRVVVTVGPGSYTGLRVGISAARGFGLAAGAPVVGVSTLSALAAPLLGREAGRLLCPAIDARHDQVYVAILDAGGRNVVPPRLTSAREAARLIGAGPVSLVGSGASLVAKEAWAIGLDAVVVDTAPAPDILWVARLGMLADPAQAPPRPLYLRGPDAQPQDRHRLARQ
jgi:tRNA threonylcarbamoyladenosine biosynthesis protein TsaB